MGKLELENMELEQHRIVHESILKGKDLTIQKLKYDIIYVVSGISLSVPFCVDFNLQSKTKLSSDREQSCLRTV